MSFSQHAEKLQHAVGIDMVKQSALGFPMKENDDTFDCPMLKNLHHSPAVNIDFTDICYHVKSNQGKKVILNSLSGSFQAGELSAIMGPSGAGKSSLMNILAAFKTSGFEGDISINKRPRETNVFRKLSCYIMQHDVLCPYLTVMEALRFSVNLRLDGTSAKEKHAVVEQTLELLGLRGTENTWTSDLSGGQRKRLTIALELISNPPVMFFDEPTSGLDSASCLQCISLLKRLAQAGRTIVCVIHQPSSMIFDTFDRLYLVAEGRCIYRGLSSRLVDFLSNLGMNCPSFYNPADYVLEIATGKYGYMVDQLVNLSENGRSEEWSRTQEPAKICDTTIAGSLETSSNSSDDYSVTPIDFFEKESIDSDESLIKTTTFSYWTQFVLLCHRSFISSIRDLTLTRLRLSVHIIVALLVGVIYQDIGNDANHVYNNAGFVFFNLLFLLFTAMMATILTFPLEMPVISREYMNNWYSLKAYYIGKTVADLPFQIVYPGVYILICYFMSGQPFESTRFLWFLCMAIMTSLVAQSIGVAIGSACSLSTAVFIGPVSTAPIFLFSGFFVTFSTIPYYLQWVTYIVYTRFGFEGSILALYGFDRPKLQCSQAYCHFKSPTKFLQQLDISESLFWVDLISLSVYYIFIRVLTYFILRYRVRRSN